MSIKLYLINVSKCEQMLTNALTNTLTNANKYKQIMLTYGIKCLKMKESIRNVNNYIYLRMSANL